MTVNDQQPFNNTPQLVAGTVDVTDMQVIVKGYAGRATIATDLKQSGEAIGTLKSTTEKFIREQLQPTQHENRLARYTWAVAAIAYGRCFVETTGRTMLTPKDVEKLNGDMACHKELMQQRDELIAHCDMEHRNVQILAKLEDPAKTYHGAIIQLDILERFHDLPSLGRLESYEQHVRILWHAYLERLVGESERLSKVLTEEHYDEVYQRMLRK